MRTRVAAVAGFAVLVAGLVSVAPAFAEPAAPQALTYPATSVTAGGVTLNARVNPELAEIEDCHFEYGTTLAYGTSIPCSPSPGAGEAYVPVSAEVSGLDGGTTYHYRVVAVNAKGESIGSEQHFTTPTICPRPRHTVWGGNVDTPKQSGHWEAFSTLGSETSPGSGVVNLTGHGTYSGTYEGFRMELVGSVTQGTVSCSGAASWEMEFNGVIGGLLVEHLKVEYTGVFTGSEGSGTLTVPAYGENGTWTGSLYAEDLSAGPQVGAVTLVTPNSALTTALSLTNTGGLPEGTVAPVGLVSYEVTEVPPGGTISLSFALPNGAAPTGIYKRVEGSYVPYPAGKTKIEGSNVTIEITDNGPYDENPELGAIRDPIAPASSSAPSFGVCEKAPGPFMQSSCLTQGGAGKYRWRPEEGHTAFTLSSGAVNFGTATGSVVSCASAHSIGPASTTGKRSVGGLTLTFVGCRGASGELCEGKTHTPFQPRGEVDSSELEGTLGWQQKASKKLALALFPASHVGPFLRVNCGAGWTSLVGSVVVPVKADKMAVAQKLKYKSKKGTQKLSNFEGEAAEPLTTFRPSGPGAITGLNMTAILTFEKALEISAVQ